MRVSAPPSAAKEPEAPRAPGEIAIAAVIAPPATAAWAGAPSTGAYATVATPRSTSIFASSSSTVMRCTLEPSSRFIRSFASAQSALKASVSVMGHLGREYRLGARAAEHAEALVTLGQEVVGRQGEQIGQRGHDRGLEVLGGRQRVGVRARLGLEHHRVDDAEPQQGGRVDLQ